MSADDESSSPLAPVAVGRLPDQLDQSERHHQYLQCHDDPSSDIGDLIHHPNSEDDDFNRPSSYECGTGKYLSPQKPSWQRRRGSPLRDWQQQKPPQQLQPQHYSNGDDCLQCELIHPLTEVSPEQDESSRKSRNSSSRNVDGRGSTAMQDRDSNYKRKKILQPSNRSSLNFNENHASNDGKIGGKKGQTKKMAWISPEPSKEKPSLVQKRIETMQQSKLKGGAAESGSCPLQVMQMATPVATSNSNHTGIVSAVATDGSTTSSRNDNHQYSSSSSSCKTDSSSIVKTLTYSSTPKMRKHHSRNQYRKSQHPISQLLNQINRPSSNAFHDGTVDYNSADGTTKNVSSTPHSRRKYNNHSHNTISTPTSTPFTTNAVNTSPTPHRSYTPYTSIHNAATISQGPITPITPKTSEMLLQSPFIHSIRLLDERLDSVKKDETRLENKIEKMTEMWAEGSLMEEDEGEVEADGDEVLIIKRTEKEKETKKEYSSHPAESAAIVSPGEMESTLATAILSATESMLWNSRLDGGIDEDQVYEGSEASSGPWNLLEVTSAKNSHNNYHKINNHNYGNHNHCLSNSNNQRSHFDLASVSDLSVSVATEEHIITGEEGSSQKGIRGLTVSFQASTELARRQREMVLSRQQVRGDEGDGDGQQRLLHQQRVRTRQSLMASTPTPRSKVRLLGSGQRYAHVGNGRNSVTGSSIATPSKRDWRSPMSSMSEAIHRYPGEYPVQSFNVKNSQSDGFHLHHRFLGKNRLDGEHKATARGLDEIKGAKRWNAKQQHISRDTERMIQSHGINIGDFEVRSPRNWPIYLESRLSSGEQIQTTSHCRETYDIGFDSSLHSLQSYPKDDMSLADQHDRENRLQHDFGLDPTGEVYSYDDSDVESFRRQHRRKHLNGNSDRRCLHCCTSDAGGNPDDSNGSDSSHDEGGDKRKQNIHQSSPNDSREVDKENQEEYNSASSMNVESGFNGNNNDIHAITSDFSIATISTCSQREGRTNRVLWKEGEIDRIDRKQTQQKENESMIVRSKVEMRTWSSPVRHLQTRKTSILSPSSAKRNQSHQFHPYKSLPSSYDSKALNTYPTKKRMRNREIQYFSFASSDPGQVASILDHCVDKSISNSEVIAEDSTENRLVEKKASSNVATLQKTSILEESAPNKEKEVHSLTIEKKNSLKMGGMFKRMKESMASTSKKSAVDTAKMIMETTNAIESSRAVNNESSDSVSVLMQQNEDYRRQLEQVTSQREELFGVVAEIRRQLTDVTNERETLTKERESWIAERGALLDERDGTIKESLELQSSYDSLAKEMISLESEMNKKMQSILESKESEINRMAVLLGNSENALDNLHLVLRSKEEKIQSMSEIIEAKDASLADKAAEKAKLEDRVEQISEEMSSRVMDEEKIRQEIETPVSEKRNLESITEEESQKERTPKTRKQTFERQPHIASANVITDESLDDEGELEEAIGLVVSTKQSSIDRHGVQSLEEVQTRLEELHSKVTMYEEKIHSMKTHHDQTEQELKYALERNAELTSEISKLQSMDSNINTPNKSESSFDGLLAHLLSPIKCISEGEDTAHTKCIQHAQTKNDFVRDFSVLSSSLVDLTELNGGVELLQSNVAPDMVDARNKSASYDSASENIKTEKDQLQEENVTLSARLREIESELKEITSSKKQSEFEYKHLEKKHNEVEERLQHLTTESESFHEQLGMKSTSLANLIAENGTFSHTVNSFTSKNAPNAEDMTSLDSGLTVKLQKATAAKDELISENLCKRNLENETSEMEFRRRISELEIERDSLRTQMESLKSHITTLSDEIAKLESQKECLFARIGELNHNAQTNELRDKMTSLISMATGKDSPLSALTIFEDRTSTMTERIKSLESENSALILKTEESKSKCQQAEESLFKLAQEAKDTKHILLHLTKERDDLLVTKQSLQDELNEVDAKAQHLSTKVLEIESRNTSLSDKVSELESERDKLSKLVREKDCLLESKIAEFESMIANVERKESLESQLSAFTQERDNLLDKIATLEEKLDNVRSEKVSMNLSMSRLSSSAEEARKELYVASVQRDDLLAKCKGLENEISALRVKHDSMLSHTQDLEAQVDSLKDTAASLESEKVTLRNQLGQNVSIMSSLQSDYDDLHNRFNELNVRVSILSDEKCNLLSQLNDANDAVEESNSKTSKLLYESEELKEDLRVIACERDSLSKKCQELSSRMSDLAVERDCMLSQKMHDMATEVDSLRKSIADLESQKAALRNQLEQKSSTISALQSENEKNEISLRAVNESASLLNHQKCNLSQLEDTKVDTSETRRLSFSPHSIATSSSPACIVDSHGEIEKMQTAILELAKENSKLDTSLEVSKYHFNQMGTTVEKSTMNIFSQLDDASERLSFDDAHATSAKAESDFDNHSRTELMAELGELKRELLSLVQEKSDLAFSLSEAQRQIDILRAQLTSTESHMQRVKEVDLQLTSQVVNIETEKENIQSKKCVDTMNRIRLHASPENSLEETRNNRDILAAELAEERRKMAVLESKFNSLRADIESSQQHAAPNGWKSRSTVAQLALIAVKLKIRSTRLSKEKSIQENQIADLKNELAAHARKSSENDQGQTIANLTSVKDQLEIELEAFQSKNAALIDEISQLKSSKQTHKFTLELAKSLSIKEIEVEQLKSLLSNRTSAVEDLQAQIQTLKDEKTRLDFAYNRATIDLKATGQPKVETTEIEVFENQSLEDLQEQLQEEKSTVSKLKNQLKDMIEEKKKADNSICELRDAKRYVEYCLEEVLNERDHLHSKVNDMHDTMAELEAEKEALSATVHECHSKIKQLPGEVSSLEALANSNESHLKNIESLLFSKINEAQSLNNTVESHEASMEELRAEIVTLRKEKSNVEENLTSLHTKMDYILNERDELALKLEDASKDLALFRKERDRLSAEIESHKSQNHILLIDSTSSDFSCNISRIDMIDGDSETVRKGDLSLTSPKKHFFEILNMSQISEEEIGSVCDKMSKAQTILSQIETERRLLKKEVKQLRRQLEITKNELNEARQGCRETSLNAKNLLEEVNQTRELLKESEAENSRMSLQLEKAQLEINQIRMESSSSSNILTSRNQLGNSILYGQLKSPTVEEGFNPKSKKISLFDISYESKTQKASNKSKYGLGLGDTARSEEKFKVEKGKSMLGIFKDMKKSGRKDKIKYRQHNCKNEEHDAC